MKVNVSKFKAKCTQYIRDVSNKKESIEITRNGKLVAIVRPPPGESTYNPTWGCLRNTIVHIADDFDDPLDDCAWEASR